ncbi:MAG: photosystem II reaction center X protein [Pseudanabaenaceae cyanobacterium bins.68]|nr:photosystem II reaction center X protein [Pseudanabaenaceae cyanobacterium bins.68]
MTPSLINFFWSLGFGVAVLGLLGGLILIASNKDKIARKS